MRRWFFPMLETLALIAAAFVGVWALIRGEMITAGWTFIAACWIVQAHIWRSSSCVYADWIDR